MHAAGMTVVAAAKALRLSKAQVYRRINAGVLAAELVSVDGKERYLVDPNSVTRYRDGTPDRPPAAELVRVPEAARILGLSPEQVRKLIRRGRLTAVRSTAVGDKEDEDENRRGRLWVTRRSMEAFVAGAGVRSA